MSLPLSGDDFRGIRLTNPATLSLLLFVTRMTKLEQPSGASVRVIAGNAIATIVNVNWYGSNCVDVVYKTADGRVANDILYRDP